MNRKQFLINEIANLVLSRLNEEWRPITLQPGERVWRFDTDPRNRSTKVKLKLGYEMSKEEFEIFQNRDISAFDDTVIPGVKIDTLNEYQGELEVRGVVFASDEREAESRIREYAEYLGG